MTAKEYKAYVKSSLATSDKAISFYCRAHERDTDTRQDEAIVLTVRDAIDDSFFACDDTARANAHERAIIARIRALSVNESFSQVEYDCDVMTQTIKRIT